ncbi:MAG: 5-(carboxyamino)imidazole ribonucleotide mutase [Candidatus Omnitrophota bacterium]
MKKSKTAVSKGLISVSVVIGSKSDLEVIQPCLDTLREFGVGFELRVLSAHRQPAELTKYVKEVSEKGNRIFIAAAGGAAALPGVIAAHTSLPVIGVPVETRSLRGLDSLLSIVQMPSGVPVASMAIGKSGPKNAALFALEIIALGDKKAADKLLVYKKNLVKPVKK